MGSYTPGPKRKGSVSSRPRMRVLGCTKREAGTLNPSGSKGLATSWLVCGTATFDIRAGLFVPVIAFAVVGAPALGDLGPARLIVVSLAQLNAASFHAEHESHDINEPPIGPIASGDCCDR